MRTRNAVVRSAIATLVAGLVAVAPAPAAASSAAGRIDLASRTSTVGLATVPNVTGLNLGTAIGVLQAAGFAVQAFPGVVDCGPPFVRSQSPAGGSSAPVGSTVAVEYNQLPGPGQDCP